MNNTEQIENLISEELIGRNNFKYNQLYNFRSVEEVFDNFIKNHINIPLQTMILAESSKEYLVGKLLNVPNVVVDFPLLIGEYFDYGSYARGVKIKPLDDIDLMVTLHAGGTYVQMLGNGQIVLKPYLHYCPISKYQDSNGYINSTIILNKIRNYIEGLHTYRKAEIHKNLNAVTLQMPSYDWNFDIVPSIGASYSGHLPFDFYLIPDGKGGWLKTDPRIDNKKIDILDQLNYGLVRSIIKLLKFWNQKGGKPSLKSYYLESIALNIFSQVTVSSISQGLLAFFSAAGNCITEPFQDPKGFGSYLNEDLDYTTKINLVSAIDDSKTLCLNALSHEYRGNHHEAIKQWQKLFGKDF